MFLFDAFAKYILRSVLMRLQNIFKKWDLLWCVCKIYSEICCDAFAKSILRSVVMCLQNLFWDLLWCICKIYSEICCDACAKSILRSVVMRLQNLFPKWNLLDTFAKSVYKMRSIIMNAFTKSILRYILMRLQNLFWYMFWCVCKIYSEICSDAFAKSILKCYLWLSPSWYVFEWFHC